MREGWKHWSDPQERVRAVLDELGDFAPDDHVQRSDSGEIRESPWTSENPLRGMRLRHGP